MPVFISYHRPDELKARTIQRLLADKSIKTYLDVLDSALSGAEQITNVILTKVRECTHILVVVSHTTSSSWWVPFEIGVATDSERRITTFNTADVALPQYLTVWPILRSFADLERFASLYLRDRFFLEKAGRPHEARAAAIQTPTDFHRALKAAIGQQ